MSLLRVSKVSTLSSYLAISVKRALSFSCWRFVILMTSSCFCRCILPYKWKVIQSLLGDFLSFLTLTILPQIFTKGVQR
ncbi:hypothetical protein HMPREF1881_01421 [Streptococcus agalactiae]|nr:hypothetical protein HMPREF1881_01421 [Streptococcus agalactiae]